MHVLDPADHPELGHRLVRRHHQLETWPLRRHQPTTGQRVPGAARAEHVLVGLRGDRPRQTETGRSSPTPPQRRLAPGAVVGHRRAGMVVGAVHHRRAVIRHRLDPHHPHPRHRRPPPLLPERGTMTNRVPGICPGIVPGVVPEPTSPQPGPERLNGGERRRRDALTRDWDQSRDQLRDRSWDQWDDRPTGGIPSGPGAVRAWRQPRR